MIPAGSSRSLTARRASIPSSPISGAMYGSVVAADRVVMGDRPPGPDDRLAGRGLDGPPLLELVARVVAGPGT